MRRMAWNAGGGKPGLDRRANETRIPRDRQTLSLLKQSHPHPS